MSFELIIRSQAESDIAEITLWYERKQKGLGNYFLLCLDASLQALKRYPTANRIIYHQYRRMFIRKFPVGVYYLVENQKILVDAVEPFSRDSQRLDEKL